MENLPIRFQQLLELPAVGISPTSISFSNLTLESSKYICVREQQPNQPSTNVVIIDMEKPHSPVRRPITADSAIMNPKDNILALKAGQTLQVFNIEQKQKLKAYQMPDPVLYWRWIGTTMIALVTAKSVFHWDTADEKSDPVKMFDRLPNLNDHQIINYHVDASQKWLVLIGIASVQGRVVGNMQLYSVERRVSQPIEGHAASFATYQVPGMPKPVTLFCFASRTAAQSKLFVIEVGASETASGPKFTRRATDIFFPAEAQGDFPVAMEIGPKYQVIYLITKLGYLHIFDLSTATLIFMNKISQDKDTIFTTTPHEETSGLIAVNRKGQVLSITINESTIINYITSKGDLELAIKMASAANLPGAEDLFTKQFQQYFQQMRYQEAAKVAADSPNQFLRTAQTIRLFQQLQSVQGQPPPVLQYFSVLLEKGKLNKLETLELARPVLLQGRKDLLEKWINEDKLDYCEELGDLMRQVDLKIALKIYLKAGAKEKIVILLAETGQFQQLVQWCAQERYQPDWMRLITVLLASNAQGAVNLAKLLLTAEGGPLVDRNAVVDAFISRNMLQETTSLLLDVLGSNKQEDGPLQTKLLELNLMQAPQVADAILGNEMFTHYNRKRIAELSEKAGLFHRALDHFTEPSDWKRVIRNAYAINADFLVNWFGKIKSPEQQMDLLKEMLASNLRQNITNAVKVAVRYWEALTPAALIKLFESFKSYEGIFFFLQPLIEVSTDAEAHFKYIEAAARLGQLKEVERVVRQSSSYEPERVRDFLKEAKLQDQLPLVIVCDKYNFVDDLTHYLYKNNMSKYIEAYVTSINPLNTPIVVGALLDEDANEDFIVKLVNTVGNLCSVDQLVEEVEKRNRLKILQNWLETRYKEGNQEAGLHNALAKIYVDGRNNAEKFLVENKFYNHKVVGKYCENRDPYLAFVAYRQGLCDKELVEVTNKHSLFKHQARYLVERQNPELWAYVLSEQNVKHRRNVIDQVVQSALPESKHPEEVSAAVKAFMIADLPNELIELLEKIILDNTNSDFSKNRNLQNLLILTAIKAHDTNKDRVMSYIKKLDNYDAPDIADIAIDAKLYEEAFTIFQKFKHNVQAIGVLIDKMGAIERATDFAEKCGQPEVFSRLAKAQLKQGLAKEAIVSYIKANDPEDFLDVIEVCKKAGIFEDEVKYLQMCRRKVRETRVESELIYALAKINKLADLEEFITGPNCANIQDVADRCFDEKMYEAARLLYNNINNFAKLAITLIRLQQFSAAVDAARKANSTTTWKEVSKACVDAKQFRLAQVAGLFIIIHGDELEELIKYYENRGYRDEVISLLENGLGLDRAHVGMFTELAILYSKYKPEKLMEHLKLFHKRLNIPKVCQFCEKNQQWNELVFLYVLYDEFDKAVTAMIKHAEDCWDHVIFKEAIVKVSIMDNMYKAISFYLEERPTYLIELLNVLSSKVDHTRVVTLVREQGHLPLIRAYLIKVQETNILAVNEALNELYIEEEDYSALRSSIDSFSNFDSMSLARKVAKHELLEFRRIAAYLFKKNGRFQQSIDLSKEDKLYQDAIKTAADSDDREIAEGLLSFFVQQKNKECFAATLFTCYDLIRPDIALEHAWRSGMMEFAFPYLIQMLREYTTKVDKLVESEEERKKQQQVIPQVVVPQVVVPDVTSTQIMQTNQNFQFGTNLPPIGVGVGVNFPPTMTNSVMGMPPQGDFGGGFSMNTF